MKIYSALAVLLIDASTLCAQEAAPFTSAILSYHVLIMNAEPESTPETVVELYAFLKDKLPQEFARNSDTLGLPIWNVR